MTDSDELALYMTVGEIRSDVKALLLAMPSMDKRLRKQETRQTRTSVVVGLFIATIAAKLGYADVAAGLFH